jgi:capsid assembly protease
MNDSDAGARFAFITKNLLNVPLALHSGHASLVTSMFEAQPYMGDLIRPDGLANALSARGHGAVPAMRAGAPARPGSGRAGDDRGYDVMRGIAVIKVSGVLVQKLGLMRPYLGMTGYDGIRLALRNAIEDKGIQAIILDIDSPGGEVAGCFDLVDAIYRARGTKPIRSILTESAFSSAYAIASATDRIAMPRTGGVGSIGIIAIVCDFSKALSKAGIAMNVLQFGARKADGYPELPLSKAGRARFQADVDTIGQLFVKTVARNRHIKPASILAMEAKTFLGAEGLRAGLVDAVAPPDIAFNALAESLDAQRRKHLRGS